MAKAIAPALWLCAPAQVTDPLHDSASRNDAPVPRSVPDEYRAGRRVCCSPTRTRPDRHTAREVHNCSSRYSLSPSLSFSRISKVLSMATEDRTHTQADSIIDYTYCTD